MKSERIERAVALGLLLVACSRPAEPTRPTAAQGPPGQASATDSGCADGTGRSLIQSKCIETPLTGQEPEYRYAPARDSPQGAGAPDPDQPAFATAGYVKPREEVKGCVGRSIRLPADRAGRLPSAITLKFAVDRSGRPGPVDILSDGLDGESTQAVGLAVQSCKWIAGRDPWGRPATVWVMLPLRFELH
jgi:protein TonB